MLKIIHISDLHFRKRERHNYAQVRRLQEIQRRFPEHLIINTGDTVDDGLRLQYHNAFEALKPFAGRIFSCMGNHDAGTMGVDYEKKPIVRYQKLRASLEDWEYRGVTDKTFFRHHVKLIALNSVRTIYPLYDLARGEIGEEQLTSLICCLEYYQRECPDQRIILMLHHHPFYRGHKGELIDYKTFQATICQFPQVKLVCCGHKHKDECREEAGIMYVAAHSLRNSQWVWEYVVEKEGMEINRIQI